MRCDKVQWLVRKKTGVAVCDHVYLSVCNLDINISFWPLQTILFAGVFDSKYLGSLTTSYQARSYYSPVIEALIISIILSHPLPFSPPPYFNSLLSMLSSTACSYF
jgi:hypothetical protein